VANPLKPITEKIADRVWRHAGDLRQGMNVYFLREDDGEVTIFVSRFTSAFRTTLP